MVVNGQSCHFREFGHTPAGPHSVAPFREFWHTPAGPHSVAPFRKFWHTPARRSLAHQPASRTEPRRSNKPPNTHTHARAPAPRASAYASRRRATFHSIPFHYFTLHDAPAPRASACASRRRARSTSRAPVPSRRPTTPTRDASISAFCFGPSVSYVARRVLRTRENQTERSRSAAATFFRGRLERSIARHARRVSRLALLLRDELYRITAHYITVQYIGRLASRSCCAASFSIRLRWCVLSLSSCTHTHATDRRKQTNSGRRSDPPPSLWRNNKWWSHASSSCDILM